MKIGIYTDPHFSKSSSILSQSSNYKYSARLDLLIKSYEWMYQEFRNNQVEVIINLGDTVSSDVLDSDTQSALAEALSYSIHVPEYWLLGNHEKRTNSSVSHSLKLLQYNPHITIVEDYTCKFFDGITFLMYPYTNEEEQLQSDIFTNLSTFQYSSCILCTHQMYQGVLPLAGGLDWNEFYKISNSNLLKIFNGHIHNPKIVGNYIQVGSLIGNSFSDDYSESLPRIIIYDTTDNSITSIVNPHSPLFYTVSAKNESELVEELGKLSKVSNKLLIRVNSYLSQKDKLLDKLEFMKNNNCILECRLKLMDDTESPESVDSKLELSNVDIYTQLSKFTELDESRPAPLPNMLQFINRLKEGDLIDS